MLFSCNPWCGVSVGSGSQGSGSHLAGYKSEQKMVQSPETAATKHSTIKKLQDRKID